MKIKYVLIAILFSMIFSSLVFATPTACTVTRDYLSRDGKVMVIKLACVGDAAGGTPGQVADTDLDDSALVSDSYMYYRRGFYLYELWTVAGTGTAPDAADITIVDEIDAQIYDEDDVLQATGTTEGSIDKYRTITSVLTVSVDNQDTADATWDIYLKLVR